MNKKILLLSSIMLMICFSAGIFTEITIPSEKISIAAALPSLAAGIFNSIKSDVFTVLAAMLFSGSVVFMPLVPFMIFGKAFSLGFSAAYILSSSEQNALGILLCALLPRGLFKIPAYVALIMLSADTAIFVRGHYQSSAALKRGLKPLLLKYLFCFLPLAISSILEAFLLLGVL